MEVSHLFSQFFDFSKVITCAVSIVLIVYGSFRAIKLEPSPRRNVRVIQHSSKSSGSNSGSSSSRKFTVPIAASSSKVGNGIGAINTPSRDMKGNSNRASLVKCPTSPACACNTRACNQRGNMTGVAVHNTGANSEGKGVAISRKEMKKHSYPRQKSDDNDDVTVLLLSPGNDVISDQEKDFQHAYGTPCSHSAKPSRDESVSTNGASLLSNAAGVQVLDSSQALLLPLGASFSLLFMFFFFDSFQVFFAIAIASVATIAFAFLVHPLCHFILKPFISLHKVSVGVLGRHLPSEILSFVISLTLLVLWLVTGHWLLMDLLSMGLCVSLIAHIRLPSLKVSSILLISLLFYDVFWVFFSSMLFSSNVMVKVATQPAENPVGLLARKLNVASVMSHAPKLSLPGKLIFPSHLSWEELGGDANVFDPAGDSEANINIQPHHHHHHYHHNLDSNMIGRMNSESMIGRIGGVNFQPMKVTKPVMHAAVAEMMLSKNLNINDAVNVGSAGSSLSHVQLMKAVAAQQGRMGENPDGGSLRFDPSQQGVGNFMAPMGAVHMHYSMLGLGDIVIPGLLLCFVLRFDYIRGRTQNIFKKEDCQMKKKETDDGDSYEGEGVMCSKWSPLEACYELGRRITIFHTTLLGYLFGLAVATVSSEVFEKAQPALLYIVPSTLIPLVITALLKGELHVMWSDPFPTSEVSCDDENNPSPSPSYSLADVHVTKRLSSMTSDTSNERIDSYPFNSDFRAALQNSSCTPKMFVEGNDAAHSLLGDLTKRGGESMSVNVRGGTNQNGRSKNGGNILNISPWNNSLDDGAVETFDDHLTQMRSSSSLGAKTYSPKDPAINGAALNLKGMSSRLSESTRGGFRAAVSMPLAVQID